MDDKSKTVAFGGPPPIPDRMSAQPSSPHYNPVGRNVDVYLDGIRQTGSVLEYCISEGWLDRYKKSALGVIAQYPDKSPVIEHKTGKIEVMWKED